MPRLSAPERTREELRALMNGDLGTAEGRSELVHLALQLIVEEARVRDLAFERRLSQRLSNGQGEDGGGGGGILGAAG
jgi:hypothetical protein